MLIFLIGYMGAGKTTLGKNLAAALNYAFKDLDELIEEEQNISITEFFSLYGECKFRIAEAALLRTFHHEDRIVIATGGGTPCSHNNIDWMNNNGITIFIDLPETILIQRLYRDQTRPLIMNMDQLTFKNYVARTLFARRKYYENAQMIVTFDSVSKVLL